MRNARTMVLASACVLSYVACSAADEPHVRLISQQIIGGGPAPERSGIAYVSHAQGDRLCSGALIAERLLLTAKHCALRSGSAGEQRVDAPGFRIGFGADDAHFAWRGVEQLTWIAAPDDTAVAAGEDIAVLVLDEPAPTGETIRDVALDFVAVDQQRVQIAGYGLSDLKSGVAGVRRFGSGRVTGYDRASGVVQISGDSACFGDSGGPVLTDDLARVMGVLGEVAGSGMDSFCDIGLSFAATAANPRVRRFLEKACAGVGGCGPAPQQVLPAADLDAGAFGGAGDSAEPDASAPRDDMNDAATRGKRDAGDTRASSKSSKSRNARAAGSGCTVARVF